jgi:carbonic anhydrase
MSVIETLTQRNEAFASSRFSADLKIMPSMKTMIIGCVDPRVDPVDIFGLAPGEAAVIRNIGGRITPATLQTMAMLPPTELPAIAIRLPSAPNSPACAATHFRAA